MVTNLNNYVKDNDDDDDDEDDDDNKDDFEYLFRDNMIAQDIYKTSFVHQDQDKRDDSFQRRIKLRLNYVVVNEGAPIPDIVYDFDFNDREMDYCFWGSRCDPALGELKEFLINDSKDS